MLLTAFDTKLDTSDRVVETLTSVHTRFDSQVLVVGFLVVEDAAIRIVPERGKQKRSLWASSTHT